MARRSELRPLVKVRSSAGADFPYVTRKNRLNRPDRLALRMYEPRIRRYVDCR